MHPAIGVEPKKTQTINCLISNGGSTYKHMKQWTKITNKLLTPKKQKQVTGRSLNHSGHRQFGSYRTLYLSLKTSGTLYLHLAHIGGYGDSMVQTTDLWWMQLRPKKLKWPESRMYPLIIPSKISAKQLLEASLVKVNLHVGSYMSNKQNKQMKSNKPSSL